MLSSFQSQPGGWSGEPMVPLCSGCQSPARACSEASAAALREVVPSAELLHHWEMVTVCCLKCACERCTKPPAALLLCPEKNATFSVAHEGMNSWSPAALLLVRRSHCLLSANCSLSMRRGAPQTHRCPAARSKRWHCLLHTNLPVRRLHRHVLPGCWSVKCQLHCTT